MALVPPATVEYVPAGQSTHTDEPIDDDHELLEQSSHVDDAISEKVPMTHGLQAASVVAAGVVENIPAWHGVQLDAPVLDVHDPGKHA